MAQHTTAQLTQQPSSGGYDCKEDNGRTIERIAACLGVDPSRSCDEWIKPMRVTCGLPARSGADLPRELTPRDLLQKKLDNSCQATLGYIVHRVD